MSKSQRSNRESKTAPKLTPKEKKAIKREKKSEQKRIDRLSDESFRGMAYCVGESSLWNAKTMHDAARLI